MKQSFFALVIIFSFCTIFPQESSTALFSDGQLRHYRAESEDFYISKNYTSVIRVTDGSFVEKKYDFLQRVLTEVLWQTNSTTPSAIKEYFYEGNSSIAKTVSVDDYTTFLRTVENKNTQGLLIESIEYKITQKEENEESDSTVSENDEETVENSETVQVKTTIEIDESKTKKISTKNISYDSEKRVVEEVIQYEDASMNTEKIVYEYKLGKDSADTYIYKDQILQKSIVYSNPTDWIETTLFPNTLTIHVTYVDNKAVLEEVFRDGEKIRERER